jgi:hypothetical protein
MTKNFGASVWVPAGSFVLAVGLSMLSGGSMHPAIARQAGGGTATCTGSAKATLITIAAGTGVTKQTPGFTFAITTQTVDTVNSQPAELIVIDTLTMTATGVVAIDTNGKKHVLGDVKFATIYAPAYDKVLPAGAQTINAAPMSITKADLLASLNDDVKLTLKNVKVRSVDGKLGLKTTTHQIVGFTCKDGTVLPSTARTDTNLNVNGAGNGAPVNN